MRLIAKSEMEQVLSAGFQGIPSLLPSYPKTLRLNRAINEVEKGSEFDVELQYNLRADGRNAEVILTVTSQTEPPSTFQLSTAVFFSS